MTDFRSSPVYKSYAKSAAACLVVVLLALLFACLALYWLPKVVGPVVAALSVLLALYAGTLACASAVVLFRYKRSSLGERDLFLHLNRSREPETLKAATSVSTGRLRRWLARRLLGHELVVGDLVEVRPWAEIRETLDERGCLEQLPFMPEMLAMCGRRAHVFRCVHRLFDYRKSRRMRHMEGTVLLVGAVCDGSRHGGCEAACHTVWKAAWLRRAEENAAASGSPMLPDRMSSSQETAASQVGSQAPPYACQLTQLHAASKPITGWSATNFLLPLVSGNVAPLAFVVGWLTYLFEGLQHKRQGVHFPAFEVHGQVGERPEGVRLKAGDRVVVRSSSEIRATLNDQFMHRGLWFEPDMLKHCGQRYCVQAEVTKLIDIVTGELLTMKTPAYILRDVHFSGERQLFNAQYEPLFWRGAWLQKDGN